MGTQSCWFKLLCRSKSSLSSKCRRCAGKFTSVLWIQKVTENYFCRPNQVTRENDLKCGSLQICVWVSDHLSFLFHDTFRHPFAMHLAPLASSSLLLPSWNTLQTFSPPPLPRFLDALSYLGRRAGFSSAWFLIAQCAAAAARQRLVLRCPGWCRGWESKGFFHTLASYFRGLWELSIPDVST